MLDPSTLSLNPTVSLETGAKSKYPNNVNGLKPPGGKQLAEQSRVQMVKSKMPYME